MPDLPFLGKATLGDLERLLDGELISGRRYRDLHFGTQDLACVTTAVRRFLRKTHFRQAEKNETRTIICDALYPRRRPIGLLSLLQKVNSTITGRRHG